MMVSVPLPSRVSVPEPDCKKVEPVGVPCKRSVICEPRRKIDLPQKF